MPCKTQEERQVRDRKAFLLHCLFVDVSVLKAVAAIKNLAQNSNCCSTGPTNSVLHEEKVRDLSIIVTRDVADASTKIDGKNDGSRVLGLSHEELAKRNLIKGVTADESATVHDTSTLGIVDIDIEDQPEGGANALNVHSLRMLLHKSSTPSPSGGEDLQSGKVLVKKVFKESVTKMGEDSKNTKSIRWELGACWVQHLQNQASTEAKVEPAVKGLGKGLLKDLKNV
ncbi:protein TSS [Tanacetum coccineum]|uniref:Protein TSS n=1 Tax=Tanacetum coccineum TaxID=301880 RepID=A0ABQ5BT17_9ASTR